MPHFGPSGNSPHLASLGRRAVRADVPRCPHRVSTTGGSARRRVQTSRASQTPGVESVETPQLAVAARGITALPLLAGLCIVAAKVALSAPRLGGQEAAVAITWLVVGSFVAVGLVLFTTGIPRVNGWACLLVGAATIPGDLNDEYWMASDLSPVGYVLEPLYLPAAVALVLRYPGPRLSRVGRWLVWGLVVSSSGVRLLIMMTAGVIPDGFYRPAQWPSLPLPAWWHDGVFLRGGYITTIVLLLVTAGVLLFRVFGGKGLSRQSLAPLAVIGAICAIAAAVDHSIWVLNLSALRGIPAALVRDLSAAAIPVALLADLLRRRAAVAAVSDKVLAAARSGDNLALQTSLRDVLVDPTLTVAVATEKGSWVDAEGRAGAEVDESMSGRPNSGRRTEVVGLDDGRPLVAVSYSPDAVQDTALLRTAMAAVRVGAENIRLNADLLARMAELRESRARIVEAGMTERRRVERDLHDGAQQQFLAVAATLALTDLVDDGQVREVVDDARARLSSALRELRQLARGIHPAALSQGGLAAALPTLAAAADPTPVQINVDADLTVNRPPPAQESAVYFLVAEALTNAVRHARSARVRVDVGREQDQLVASISDDGAGGAQIVPGGGLAGLVDRVEALGGHLNVHGDPCSNHPNSRGTTLTASLPNKTPT